MSLGEGWPQTGLVGGWHLNGNSTDFSGNNNHGTDTSITYSQANGKFGHGGGFNGSTSKVVIANAASLKPTTAFTIQAWIKTSTINSAQAIFQTYSANTSSAGIRVQLSGASNSIYFLSGKNTGTTSGTDFADINGGIIVNNGTWRQIVCIWDGSNIIIYVDGSLDISRAWANAPAYAATNYVRIGCTNLSGSDTNFFNGAIDEVQLYSVAKSAQWVRQQYALGVGKLQ